MLVGQDERMPAFQKLRAFTRTARTPGRERRMRGIHGCQRIGRAAIGHMGKAKARGRVADRQPGATLRILPLVVDKVLLAQQIGLGEGQRHGD